MEECNRSTNLKNPLAKIRTCCIHWQDALIMSNLIP
jgi:hypothetical protein